jgi:hypothetical protein
MEQIEKPTEKQLEYIEDLQEITGIIFTGKTKKEASQYIDVAKKRPENLNEWAVVNGYF